MQWSWLRLYSGTTAEGGFTYNIHVNVSQSSSSGGNGGSGITNASETALTQQYSSSHEATPNAKISNLAGILLERDRELILMVHSHHQHGMHLVIG